MINKNTGFIFCQINLKQGRTGSAQRNEFTKGLAVNIKYYDKCL